MIIMIQRSVFNIPIYCNYRKIDRIYPPHARSILARDYKGFGTSKETSNGVIQYNETDTNKY